MDAERSHGVSVSKELLPWTQHVLYFNSMTRNLKDNPSFYVWIAKLWDYDRGLTVKHMNRHAADFGVHNLNLYNRLLIDHGMEKWCLN